MRNGTTAIAVLGVQIQEIAKDLAHLDAEMKEHRKEHQAVEQVRQAGRRWLFMAFVAVVAAIDGPIVAVLLATHGGH